MYSDLDKQYAEVAGILEDTKPRRVTVYWHDDGPVNLEQVDEITDMSDLMHVRARGVSGGGGTSCVPVFDHIMDQHERPDMVICLTDTYTDFPDYEPPFPVIWAVVIPEADAKARVPWGDVVEIN
jgi:predicted metal-dependent peptidase